MFCLSILSKQNIKKNYNNAKLTDSIKRQTLENKPHTSKSMFNCKCKHQNCCLQMEIPQCRCWKVCQTNYFKCTNKLIRWIRNFTLPSVFISCSWVLVLNNSRWIQLTSRVFTCLSTSSCSWINLLAKM